MGSLSRFRGRLFSHTNSIKLQKIPPFHTQQSSLAVQGTSFRTVSSPLHFHRSHGSSELSVSSKRYKNSPLSRRLVDKSRFEGSGDKTCTLSQTLNVRSRTESKRTEKSIRTNPKNHFLGYLYDLTEGTVRPTQENVNKMIIKTSSLLHQSQGTAEEWLSMNGLANAIAPLTPFGRLTVCPLEIHVHQH